MSTRWNEDVDPGARIIQPVGLPLGIITVSSIFLFFSILFTGIRTYVRYQDRVLGWDDWLMVGGTVRLPFKRLIYTTSRFLTGCCNTT